MKSMSEESLGEMILGKVSYIHKMDEEYDYLMDGSTNKVKVTLKFTRSLAKNEIAKKGLTAFFTGVSS